jgi:hypothetical protein
MSYLIAINAKDLEKKDKDKCLKSRTKYAKGKARSAAKSWGTPKPLENQKNSGKH